MGAAGKKRLAFRVTFSTLHDELPHTDLTGRITPLRQPTPMRKPSRSCIDQDSNPRQVDINSYYTETCLDCSQRQRHANITHAHDTNRIIDDGQCALSMSKYLSRISCANSSGNELTAN